MNPRRARVETSKRYELVAAALRVNIAAGRLPPGLVLLEGSIAGLLKTSRAPVQAALRILEEEDLVRRFEGRGYLVGGREIHREAPSHGPYEARTVGVGRDRQRLAESRPLGARL